MEPQDPLAKMFKMQEQLNERVIPYFKNIPEQTSYRQEWTLKYIRAMQQELAELTDCVPWKWWAKYQEEDRQNAKVEIIDLFHFLISLALVQGLTPEDLFEAYKKKWEINNQRQDAGYKTKDENDCKEI